MTFSLIYVHFIYFKALLSSNLFTFYYFSDLSKPEDTSINPPSVGSIQDSDSINSEELPSQVNSNQTPPFVYCVLRVMTKLELEKEN